MDDDYGTLDDYFRDDHDDHDDVDHSRKDGVAHVADSHCQDGDDTYDQNKTGTVKTCDDDDDGVVTH